MKKLLFNLDNPPIELWSNLSATDSPPIRELMEKQVSELLPICANNLIEKVIDLTGLDSPEELSPFLQEIFAESSESIKSCQQSFDPFSLFTQELSQIKDSISALEERGFSSLAKDKKLLLLGLAEMGMKDPRFFFRLKEENRNLADFIKELVYDADLFSSLIPSMQTHISITEMVESGKIR